jgi:taurine--2-oxoglutarate transaminase
LSGAEANENAVKIARLVTGRYKVVTRFRSYHGATLATVGMSGDYRRIPFDGTIHGVVRIPDPYPRGSGQHIDTVRLLEETIEIEGPETIACVLLEGITGANGVFVPPPDYWTRIREICSRYGIMLIADEVFSGFGRTGKWFGVDHFGVTPDIMTVAKGITGGYGPLGAVIVNEKIANFFENETLWCGLTNYGHPLLCALANKAIAIIEEEGLLENAAKRGAELKVQLQGIQQGCDLVAEVRSIGLMSAIDLQKSKDDPRPYVAYRAKGEEAKKASQLQSKLADAGLICTVRFGTILLAPPLCVTAEQIKKATGIIGEVLKIS